MAALKLPSIFKKFTDKILDMDSSAEIPRDQLEMLSHYSARFYFNTDIDDVNALMQILQKKHLVDDICITSKDGALIHSTNGTTPQQALNETALFNYIQSELPKPQSVFVNADGWTMFFPFGDKLYTIRASSNLTHTELHALAKEVEEHLKKRNHI